MTAAVVMALVERGMVGLNEPAAVTLPELEEHGHGDVLVHHLLTHTSGWNWDDLEADFEARTAEVVASPSGDRDLLSEIFLTGIETPRRRPVGEVMQYANLNYSLLSEIVRRVTGGTFDAAAREHLFEPTEMADSCIIVPDELRDRVIERPPGIPFGPGHEASPISFNDRMWADSDDGASGVHSTALDCLRFGQMLLDGGVADGRRVLSPDAVRVMTTNRIPGVPAELLTHRADEASWGLGWAVQEHSHWALHGGALSPWGVPHHGGAGGIDVWINPALGIVGAYFEMVTEWDWEVGPRSWAAHRFEDVINAAVLD